MVNFFCLKTVVFNRVLLLYLLCVMGCDNSNHTPPTKKSQQKVTQRIPPVNKTDSSQKIATPTTIEFQPIVYDSTKQYIYLTFDDGPQNGTEACLNLCKQLQVKATFFMVGRLPIDSIRKKLVRNIKHGYPQILLANHSYTHANSRYKYFYHHPRMALYDFLAAQKVLTVPFKIIRLPGNPAWVTNKGVKASKLVWPVCELLDSADYHVAGWDVEWNFNHKNANPIETPQKMLQYVDSAFAKGRVHTPNHLVILTHDRMFRKPNYTDSLSKFIQLLQKNPRYVFETIDHYPGIGN